MEQKGRSGNLQTQLVELNRRISESPFLRKHEARIRALLGKTVSTANSEEIGRAIAAINKLDSLANAIKDGAFSEDRKRNLMLPLESTLINAKLVPIEIAIRNVESVLGIDLAIQRAKPGSEGIAKSTQTGLSSGPTAESSLDKQLREMGLRTDTVQNRDLPPEVKQMMEITRKVHKDIRDSEMTLENAERIGIEGSNPTLARMRYGKPDAFLREMKLGGEVFIAVFTTEEKKDVPLGIMNKMFFDSGSDEITAKTAKNAYAHYIKELEKQPRSIHKVNNEVGLFAKVVVVDTERETHAIVFYSNSVDSIKKVNLAHPTRER
ncbi:MAG: hypothetical protein ABIF01_01615 [Candidatus Micrarchaeota archaeon]